MPSPTIARPQSKHSASHGVAVGAGAGGKCESRIDALTSLRFIAAAMIVVTHSVTIFSMDPTGNIAKLPLSQGVSFFFVLSGFILTYVYKRLDGWKATLRFLS